MSGKSVLFIVFILLFGIGAAAQTKGRVGARPDGSRAESSLPNKSDPEDKNFAELYFTLADAEKVSGEPMQIQSKSDDGFEIFCKYRPVDNSSHVLVGITFQIHKSARRAKAAGRESKKMFAELGFPKSIKKIKDGVWLFTRGIAQMIDVRHRNITFQIHVLDNTGKRLYPEAITEIAERITGRLIRDRGMGQPEP